MWAENIDIPPLFNSDSNPRMSTTEMFAQPGRAFDLNPQAPPLMGDVDTMMLTINELLGSLNLPQVSDAPKFANHVEQLRVIDPEITFEICSVMYGNQEAETFTNQCLNS